MAEILLIDYNDLPESPLDWLCNRAFQYGDGLFETMLFYDGTVRFAAEHVERLTEGLEVLELENPFTTSPIEYINNLLPQLLNRKEISKARLKLMVWRRGGGKYTPETNESTFALIADPYAEQHSPINELGFVMHDQSQFTYFHSFKSLSSMKYVMAGNELRKSNCDMLLFQTAEGLITESIHANFYVYRNDEILSPNPSLGLIHGTLLRKLQKNKFPRIVLDHISMNSLRNDDTIFLGNVSGLRLVNKLENYTFSRDETKLNHLRRELGFAEFKQQPEL